MYIVQIKVINHMYIVQVTVINHLYNVQMIDYSYLYNVQVIDTLPSMMNALRMVWIISKHYNRDERMVPLMEMIAWELAERVQRVTTFRTLFEYVAFLA